MDRPSVTYPLQHVKELIREGKCEFTAKALEDIQDHFGQTEGWAWDVMLTLDGSHFYKSTNSYHNHKIWFDVYKTRYEGYEIYIKFRLIETREGMQVIGQEVKVTSFKSDTSSSHSSSR